MGRGRKSILKISESEFVKCLLDKLVDDDGNKVSCRLVWSDPEFIKYTGMRHQSSDDTEIRAVSVGTLRYWQNVKKYNIPVLSEKYGKKFTLCEFTLFKYHKEVTGRIEAEISFSDFSREKNRGYSGKHRHDGEKLKTNTNILNDISRELGHISRVKDFSSISDFEDFLRFRFTDEKFDEIYEKVIKEYN